MSDATDSQGASPSAGVAVLHRIAEQLVARHAEGAYREEALRAKAEYFDHAGKVFDDDGDIFESRLAAFLEWYVLERPLEGVGAPPALVWLEREANAQGGVPSETARALAALCSSHRSLFDVGTVTDDTVELEDLLGGARFVVTERRSTVGFEEGQIVEARLLWDGERVVFGKTFLFHPREARQEVLAHVDGALAAGVSPKEVVFQLARLHLRWHRSRHISAVRIYGESRVGEPRSALAPEATP
ncbi:MAG: hypothetical protein KA712_25850 [Myxococcales bacterium]|nr:hypothetical protein [Myxococcales bacterium]